MKRNPYQGDANALRGDPINGPHNTAKRTSSKTKKEWESASGKGKADNDSETDGGFMLTTSEIEDFAEGSDSYI